MQYSEQIINSIRPIFEKTETIITAMSVGDRKVKKDMFEEVGIALNMTPNAVAPFVLHFMRNVPSLCTYRVGKNGGCQRIDENAINELASEVEEETVETSNEEQTEEMVG